MYKHILVATDGSALSRKAIRTAVGLAKSEGARVTGVYAIRPFVPMSYGEGIAYASPRDAAAYRKAAEREAKKALATLDVEARIADVPSARAIANSALPWQGILRTAKSRKCDLIVMASHGRGSIGGLILGSETTKVLSHSKIPVLVCR